jgi:hypothetical protein
MIMRTLLFFVFMLSFSVIGISQSVVGDWYIDEAGWKLTFKSDGTYSVDVGMDGKVDVTGKYSIDGSTITIQDDAGCTAEGKYKFGVDNSSMWVDPISDGCAERNPQQKVYFRKG